MKRLFLIFLVLLGACSEQDIIPRDSNVITKPLPPSISPQLATCKWANFNLDFYVDPNTAQLNYNDPIVSTFYNDPVTSGWRVRQYFATILVSNRSTTNTIGYKRNGVTNFYLNPGESKVVIMQNNCDCELTCPFSVSEQWSWTTYLVTGSGSTRVEMRFLSIQPSHTMTGITFFCDFYP